MITRHWYTWTAALGLMLASHLAGATTLSGSDSASLVFADSQVVVGETASTDQFNVSSAGTLLLSLTDLLPTADPFQSLMYQLSDGTSNLSPLTAAGNIVSYDVSGPMTLYADVFAQAGSDGFGIYTFNATLVGDATPVPIPGSGPLLLAASVLLLGLGMGRDARCLEAATRGA